MLIIIITDDARCFHATECYVSVFRLTNKLVLLYRKVRHQCEKSVMVIATLFWVLVLIKRLLVDN